MKVKRRYYRIPPKTPANRVEGGLAEAIRCKFAEGWPKARIAREFRLNRRTVISICAALAQPSQPKPVEPEPPPPPELVRCPGCGIRIPRKILRPHWPNCPAVREGQFSLADCPV